MEYNFLSSIPQFLARINAKEHKDLRMCSQEKKLSENKTEYNFNKQNKTQ